MVDSIRAIHLIAEGEQRAGLRIPTYCLVLNHIHPIAVPGEAGDVCG